MKMNTISLTRSTRKFTQVTFSASAGFVPYAID